MLSLLFFYLLDVVKTKTITASSKFTLIQENATVRAAGKTFTCNVYDQVTKSDASGALDVEGQLWFDKNYGLIKADLTTVKMELIKINK